MNEVAHSCAKWSGGVPGDPKDLAISKDGNVLFLLNLRHEAYEGCNSDFLQHGTYYVAEFLKNRTGPVAMVWVASQGLLDPSTQAFTKKKGAIRTTKYGDSVINWDKILMPGYVGSHECGLLKKIIAFTEMGQVKTLLLKSLECGASKRIHNMLTYPHTSGNTHKSVDKLKPFLAKIDQSINQSDRQAVSTCVPSMSLPCPPLPTRLTLHSPFPPQPLPHTSL